MTLKLELTPDDEARLARAARDQGLSVEEVARRLLAEHLPPLEQLNEDSDPTLALLAQWDREDAHLTPDEVAEERRLWNDFKRNVNAERERAGSRRLF
ncbi:MAG: hypothetical protein ACK47B_05125 [Armatimonadota bacterium]